MAMLIMVDGSEIPVFGKISREDLRKLVDGDVEIVVLSVNAADPRERLVLVVDEAGQVKGKPVNPQATRVFNTYRGSTDRIHGDAVLAMLIGAGTAQEEIQ